MLLACWPYDGGDVSILTVGKASSEKGVKVRVSLLLLCDEVYS